MTRGGLLAGAVAGTFLAVSINAGLAVADDQPHFFNNDPSVTGWNAGCALTYSLTPEAADYAPYAEAAYAAISGPTNFSFTRLPDGDTSASIRISIDPGITNGAAGWGGTDGSVTLTPLALLPDWRNDVTNTNIRNSLLAHESLHTLGLEHDTNMLTPDESEVMYPILGTGPLVFGPSDLAGLTVLKTQNHCISPGVQDPAFVKPAVTPGTGSQVSVVLTVTTKKHCKKHHGQWDAATHQCFYATGR
jgi:hypothetical protein